MKVPVILYVSVKCAELISSHLKSMSKHVVLPQMTHLHMDAMKGDFTLGLQTILNFEPIFSPYLRLKCVLWRISR